jgi:hypothetical protein
LGVGSIKDGSTVEITIDGIGSLVNALAARPGALAPNSSRALLHEDR